MASKQGDRFKQAESYRLQISQTQPSYCCILFCSSSERAESPLHSKPSEILLPIISQYWATLKTGPQLNQSNLSTSIKKSGVYFQHPHAGEQTVGNNSKRPINSGVMGLGKATNLYWHLIFRIKQLKQLKEVKAFTRQFPGASACTFR